MHSPHLPARGRRHPAAAVFLLRSWPTVGRLFEACAGRRIRWLCPPAVACSAGGVPAFTLCLPSPLPSSTFLPPFKLFCPVHLLPCALPPFIAMCARITVVRASSLLGPAVCCATSLQATKLSRWQLQHGPAVAARAPVHFVDSYPFSCRVHDPGPWVSVEFRLRCLL